MPKLVHFKQIDIVFWATESGNKPTKPIDLAKYAIKIKTMLKLYLFRLKEHGKLIYKFYGFIAYAPTQINSQSAHAFCCIFHNRNAQIRHRVSFNAKFQSTNS